jgi:hypothetical protein
LGFGIWDLGFFSFGGLSFQDQNKKIRLRIEIGYWSLVISEKAEVK